MGRSYDGASFSANSTFNNVKIFNVALTAQEVLDYYNNATFTFQNKATLYLPFNLSSYDPTNTRFLDVSGKGNHCAYSGTVTKLATKGVLFGANAQLTLPALPATYTVVYGSDVGGIKTISFANTSTVYDTINSAGSFAGNLYTLQVYPFLLTQIQKNDITIRELAQINKQ